MVNQWLTEAFFILPRCLSASPARGGSPREARQVGRSYALPHRASLSRRAPPPAGEGKRCRPRGARERDADNERHERIGLRTNKGRRSAGRRHCLEAASRIQMLPPARASDAARADRSAHASRRSTAVLARLLPLAQPRAAFPGITGCKREDPPRCQCSELLTVRHVPDERGPEAARERFARPRAGTAPAPHLRIASGMRPSMGGSGAHLPEAP